MYYHLQELVPYEYLVAFNSIPSHDIYATIKLLLAGGALGKDGSFWIPADADKHGPPLLVNVRPPMRYTDYTGIKPTDVEPYERRVPTFWVCMWPVYETQCKRMYAHTFDGIMCVVKPYEEPGPELWCPSKCPKTSAALRKIVLDDLAWSRAVTARQLHDMQMRAEREKLEEGNRG